MLNIPIFVTEIHSASYPTGLTKRKSLDIRSQGVLNELLKFTTILVTRVHSLYMCKTKKIVEINPLPCCQTK